LKKILKVREANELIRKAEHKSESSLLVSIKHLIKLLLKEETPAFWADDPISVAVTSFFLLQDRQYDLLLDFSKTHLKNLPQDLIMQVFTIESIFSPVRDEVFDDPPLPGGSAAELSLKLDELRILTKNDG
jgi:hypothetical protein